MTLLFLVQLYKIEMYVSTEKNLINFLKLFRTSIPPLWGKELKDLLISNVFADNIFPASYGLRAPSAINETIADSA